MTIHLSFPNDSLIKTSFYTTIISNLLADELGYILLDELGNMLLDEETIISGLYEGVVFNNRPERFIMRLAIGDSSENDLSFQDLSQRFILGFNKEE